MRCSSCNRPVPVRSQADLEGPLCAACGREEARRQELHEAQVRAANSVTEKMDTIVALLRTMIDRLERMDRR